MRIFCFNQFVKFSLSLTSWVRRKCPFDPTVLNQHNWPHSYIYRYIKVMRMIYTYVCIYVDKLKCKYILMMMKTDIFGFFRFEITLAQFSLYLEVSFVCLLMCAYQHIIFHQCSTLKQYSFRVVLSCALNFDSFFMLHLFVVQILEPN